MAVYEDLLRRWAPKLDLVAPGDLDRIGPRHIEDALRAVPLLDGLPEGPAVDVGSGAGLPGVPLALAARPRPWRLLEPRRRRAAFLEEVIRELSLDVEVVSSTAEDAAADSRLCTHVVAVARALAPPGAAFSLLLPLLGEGGTAVLWIGQSAELPPEAALWTQGLATMRKA
ncbi:MAG TPA: RsmG family class I SAM-dependent methyltransferase [Actinomycetota bacterium]|nr:RsmG family class I SAM-dependent methyltransferase [Actinomycetota bacterium]